jgi:hypothetical protein
MRQMKTSGVAVKEELTPALAESRTPASLP